MTKLTESEFLRKWGRTQMRFVSYYKFSFRFCGEADEHQVTAYVGGSSDDIYRFRVDRDDLVSMDELPFNLATAEKGYDIIDECNIGW